MRPRRSLLALWPVWEVRLRRGVAAQDAPGLTRENAHVQRDMIEKRRMRRWNLVHLPCGQAAHCDLVHFDYDVLRSRRVVGLTAVECDPSAAAQLEPAAEQRALVCFVAPLVLDYFAVADFPGLVFSDHHSPGEDCGHRDWCLNYFVRVRRRGAVD